jgi:hypothetical protein
LYNADISGFCLVQSQDCGVHYHCDTTAAVPSYTLLHTATHSASKLRTGSDKHNKEIRKRKKVPPSFAGVTSTNAHKNVFTNKENDNLKLIHCDITQHTILGVLIGMIL